MKKTLLLLLSAVLLSTSASAQYNEKRAAAAQEGVEEAREEVITNVMAFSAKEAEAFWPIYRAYRGEMAEAQQGVIEIIMDYADSYPEVGDEQAESMVEDYLKLQKSEIKIRNRIQFIIRLHESSQAARRQDLFKFPVVLRFDINL